MPKEVTITNILKEFDKKFFNTKKDKEMKYTNSISNPLSNIKLKSKRFNIGQKVKYEGKIGTIKDIMFPFYSETIRISFDGYNQVFDYEELDKISKIKK